MASPSLPAGPHEGLAALRRSGTVTELLFLYECATREVAQLRSVAEPLGLTVQAVSHTFRGLVRRGRVELRDGRYRPTVAGVAWMHATLGTLERDLVARLERLHIVRTTRALARRRIEAGQEVVLALEDGWLTARPGGSGPSRGRARGPAAAGELVEIVELEGIVPLRRGKVRFLVVPSERVEDPTLARSLGAALRRAPPGWLGAQGLEAFHLTQQARPPGPIVRFGIASAVEEATHLGLDCTVVVTDREVPRLLNQFEEPQPPAFEFESLAPARSVARGRH